jgi:hypothetical protein
MRSDCVSRDDRSYLFGLLWWAVANDEGGMCEFCGDLKAWTFCRSRLIKL